MKITELSKKGGKIVFNRNFTSDKTISEEINYFLENLPMYHETANPLLLPKAFNLGYEIQVINSDVKVTLDNITADELKNILTQLRYFNKIAIRSITEMFLTDFILSQNDDFALGYKREGRKMLIELKEQIEQQLLLCDTK